MLALLVLPPLDGGPRAAIPVVAASEQGRPTTGAPGIAVTTAELNRRSSRVRRAGATDVVAPSPAPRARGGTEKSSPSTDNDDNGNDNDDASPFAGLTVARPRAGRSVSMNALTPDSSFDGITLADANVIPPDPTAAVGPTQILMATNGRIRSYDKSSGMADGELDTTTDAFFASVISPAPPSGTVTTRSPHVRYDRMSRRWIVVMMDQRYASDLTTQAPNRLLIAVSGSDTVSVGTVWTFFQFRHDEVGTTPNSDTNGVVADPKVGIDDHAIYIGVNVYTAGGTFVGTTGFVVRKSSVLGSGPIVVTPFRQLVAGGSGNGPFAPVGVDNFDVNPTYGYFIGPDNALFSRLVLRRVSDPGGTPSISGNLSLTVPTTAFPNRVPHKGNTGGFNGHLGTLDDRFYSAVVRDGYLWTAHHIRVNASGVANIARRPATPFAGTSLALSQALQCSDSPARSSTTPRNWQTRATTSSRVSWCPGRATP